MHRRAAAPPTRPALRFPFAFRSFRARLITFILGLLLLVQGGAFLAVNSANLNNARLHVDETLEFTANDFERTLRARERTLVERARLLSGDFAFKEAVAMGEHGTLLSALENQRARVMASVMMLVSMDEDALVEADTLHPDRQGGAFDVPELLRAAEESEFGEASSIEFIDDRAHQLVVTPLFMPEPEAWIVIGFRVDDDLAADLKEGTGTEVSLLRKRGGHWVPFASTLNAAERPDLSGKISPDLEEARTALSMPLDGREFRTWVAPAGSVGRDPVVTVLQRSLDEALEPYLRLRVVLGGIFAVGVAMSVLGGVLLASRVTRPVATLARGATRVAEGDYTQRVHVSQRDELGLLADSFNQMTEGLAERDRVRNLLGKVVSPAVAEELLSKEIELGGEERLVSVLFSDVRNFTSLSERSEPHELVRLLNAYLTRVSDIVEEHEGIVDKYIGDAVMAVFGAPLGHPDDAQRAVRTALAMADSMDAINADLGLSGDARLGMGVGVSTGVVVAGNMGSTTRLNYTVIGDSVNVASRLEGLTKQYGVGVIVGPSTRAACPDLLFRELDRVRVKGRDESIAIHEALGERSQATAAAEEGVRAWESLLEHFRARDWDAAEAALERLGGSTADERLHGLYRERIAHYRHQPPPPDWDGTTTWNEK